VKFPKNPNVLRLKSTFAPMFIYIYTVYILERVDTIVFQIFRGKIPQLSPGRSAGSLPGLRCVDFRPIEVAGFFPSKKWDSKGNFTIL